MNSTPRSVRCTECPFSSSTKSSVSSRSRIRCCFVGSLRSAMASSSIRCTSCLTPVSFSILSSRLFFGMPSCAWYSLSAAVVPCLVVLAAAARPRRPACSRRRSASGPARATWRLYCAYLSSRLVAHRARDDERRARLVDEDRVDLVDDRVRVLPLHALVERDHHVVAQVVEAELVVRAVGDVALGRRRGAPASPARCRRGSRPSGRGTCSTWPIHCESRRAR